MSAQTPRPDSTLDATRLRAEQRVLGAIALDSRAFDRVPTLQVVEPECFAVPEHQRIFRAQHALWAAGTRTYDLVTVPSQDPAVDVVYFQDIVSRTPETAGLEDHLAVVLDGWVKGVIAEAGLDIAGYASNGAGRDSVETFTVRRMQTALERIERVRGAAAKSRIADLLLPWPTFDAIDWPNPPWLVPEWLPGGALVFCFGRPGASKTYMLLDLARALATATPWLGIDTGSTPRRVGFLELDLRASELKTRLRRLNEAAGGTLPENLHLAAIDTLAGFDLASQAGELLEAVQRLKLELLVCDPFGQSHSLNQNDNQQMSTLVRALRPIWSSGGCTLLFNSHPRKDQPGDDSGELTLDAHLGAVALIASMHSAWTVVEHADHRHVVLRPSKRNLGPQPPARWFRRVEHGVLVPCDDPGDLVAQRNDQLLAAMSAAGGRLSGAEAARIVLAVEPGLAPEGFDLEADHSDTPEGKRARKRLMDAVRNRIRTLGWTSEKTNTATGSTTVWVDSRLVALAQPSLELPAAPELLAAEEGL